MICNDVKYEFRYIFVSFLGTWFIVTVFLFLFRFLHFDPRWIYGNFNCCLLCAWCICVISHQNGKKNNKLRLKPVPNMINYVCTMWNKEKNAEEKEKYNDKHKTGTNQNRITANDAKIAKEREDKQHERPLKWRIILRNAAFNHFVAEFSRTPIKYGADGMHHETTYYLTLY